MLLTMVSLDRYLTIHYPFFYSMNNRKTRIPKIMAAISWLISCGLSIPTLINRSVLPDKGCEELWLNTSFQQYYTLGYLSFLYLVPVLVIPICHLSVSSSIYATSLKASAASGEIPLPMPLVAGNRDVIVMSSIPQAVSLNL